MSALISHSRISSGNCLLKSISHSHSQSFLEDVCSGITTALYAGLSAPLLIQHLFVQITGWNLWGYENERSSVVSLEIYSVVREKACTQMTLIIVGYLELQGMQHSGYVTF